MATRQSAVFAARSCYTGDGAAHAGAGRRTLQVKSDCNGARAEGILGAGRAALKRRFRMSCMTIANASGRLPRPPLIITRIACRPPSVDSQFPVDPHATRGAPRRVARASASFTVNTKATVELSASSVDSQFPVDPHASRGAPRRVARAATRSCVRSGRWPRRSSCPRRRTFRCGRDRQSAGTVWLAFHR